MNTSMTFPGLEITLYKLGGLKKRKRFFEVLNEIKIVVDL